MQNEEILSQRDLLEKQNHIIEQRNKDITDSITYAKRIQNAILPSNFGEVLPNSFVLYLPKDVVAGDFYWLQKVDNAKIVCGPNTQTFPLHT